MAIDRQQKKKQKRAKKRKERHQKKERENRSKKLEEYAMLADEAMYQENYEKALSWALKRIKYKPIDANSYYIALDSAHSLGKREQVHSIIIQCWQDGVPLRREDYLVLGQSLVNMGSLDQAQELYQQIQAGHLPLLEKAFTKKHLRDVENALEYIETLKSVRDFKIHPIKSISNKKQPEPEPEPEPEVTVTKSVPLLGRTPLRKVSPPKELPPAEPQPDKPSKLDKPDKPSKLDKPSKPDQPEESELLEPKIVFNIDSEPILATIRSVKGVQMIDYELTLQAFKLAYRSAYEQLLCLATLHDVKSFWYQEETARKVMKTYRGRAILADEVGLGKTIEASLILKEYLMRNLIRSALILTPTSLVNQWQSELTEKFHLSFITTNDTLLSENPSQFWNSPFIIASINVAKSRRNFDLVTARSYDMVVVDEAHHLKNRATLNWKLVNAIQKTFLLLLTATPVENKLEELYNLVTLLKPGHLKTRKAFMAEFVTRGNPTDPQNREKLRHLLKEVMIRNTRSVAQINLPPRFASTVKVIPSDQEMEFYNLIDEFIIKQNQSSVKQFTKPVLQHLLAAAGSSHLAALNMLNRIVNQHGKKTGQSIRKIIKTGNKIHETAKATQVLKFLMKSSDQTVVFFNYIATLDYLQTILHEYKLPFVVFKGTMRKEEKQKALEKFREGCPIFLSTGTGGEGHNLQFCHTMINYDLPWNPMQIEQRIGRIHRIGQENEVNIYNFCASGSLEDHILDVLDRKINMFELVIGEMDMILGRLKGEQEFSDIVYELWVNDRQKKERQIAFDKLANRLKRARTSYQKSKELDEKLFQEDFGV